MPLPTVEVEPETSAAPAQALIEEARRRQRRRWLLAAAAVVVVAVVTAALFGDSGPGSRPRPGIPVGHRAPAAPVAGTQPKTPGSLAVGHSGVLYVADDTRHQILERLPDGRFRIVAGNGTAGFSGDGGPAVDAEIDDPGGMAVAPDGTLYFADDVNALDE
jgi:hypothetical protein